MTYSQNALEGPLPCAVSTKDALRTHAPPTHGHLLISTGTLNKADNIKERRGASSSSKMVPGSHWNSL